MSESANRFRWRLIACCSLLIGLALTQSPGLLVPDTKLDLAIAPWEFLGRVAHLWDAEGAFGQLQNQAYGYLWPMGPFFALGDLLNLEGWVVQRLWLALVMCVAFVGAAKVSREMGVRSDLACLLAAFAYALSPRMLTTLGPISIEAWPSALAPWVLLPLVIGSERGSPRRAAALSALAVAMVGGVNAAATAAVLPLGAIWLLTRGPGPRRRALMIWWPTFTLVATLWWLIPLFTLGAYSPPFLDFIESADVTTIPTDLFDVMRGTSDWVPYVDSSSRAGNDLVRLGFIALNSGVLLVAGLIGITWRRTPHRLFLVTSLLVGMFLVSMGHMGAVRGIFAPGLHDLLDGPLAPLRNVHKFDPVVRLPLVLGLAWAVDSLIAYSRSAVAERTERVNARILVGIVAFAAALAALPVATGRVTPAAGFESVPQYWQQTADWLAEDQEEGVALLLPGSMFANYVWGNPQDEPMQVLADSPWAVRNAVPLTPPGNIRMLDAIESRINQGYGSAGLAAYMRRSGISHIVVRNDVSRSDDIPDPVLVHAALEASPGISQVKTFGPVVGGEAYIDGELGRALINSGWQNDSAAIEIYALDDVSSFASTGDAEETPVIVGGPENILDLVDLGVLGDGPAVLAADADSKEIAGPVILADGYRSVVRHFGRMHDSTSATLTRAESKDLPTGNYDYYLADPQRWSTFADYIGVADVSASDSISDVSGDLGNIRPGSLPYAAIDGDERTAWQSDRLSNDGHWWQVDLEGSRQIESIELTGTRSSEQEIVVSTDDWESDTFILQPGATTRVPVGQQASFIKITDVSRRTATPMELSEVSIPGIVAERTLALPELPEGVESPDAIVLSALADHRRGCTTVDGDTRCVTGRAVSGEEQYAFNRRFTLNAAREYDARLTVQGIAGEALDSVILQGQFVTATASSSGVPDVRASVLSAIDGLDTTTWTAAPFELNPSIDLSWLSPQTIRGLDIQVDPATAARAPKTLTLTWPDGQRKVTLDETGHASFAPIRTRKLTLEVGEAEPVNSIDFTGAASLVPVGITELRLQGAGGLPLLYDDTATTLPCGSGPELEVNGITTQTRIVASPTDLVSGVQAEARLCGGETVSLPAGEMEVEVRSSDAFAPDSLVLTDPSFTVAGATPIESSRLGPVRRTLAPAPGDELLSTTENVNAGWRASQDGEALTSVVVDGWRQGYLSSGDGGEVEISFAPDTPYRVGLVAGLVALVALAGGVLLGRRRRRSTEPAPLGDRVLPALVVLGLAPVAGLVLAGVWGLAVASVVALAVWFLAGRSDQWTRLFYAAALLPAVGAAFVRPWGSSSGWVGQMSWPHYLVVAVLSGAVALVAVDSRRRKRP